MGRLGQLAALPCLLQIQQHGVAGPAVGAGQGLQLLFRKVLPLNADSLVPHQRVFLRQALGLAAARLDGVIAVLQQGAVLRRSEAGQQLQPLLTQCLGGAFFHTALLNAHIHHVAHQVGQAQVAHGLAEQQRQAQGQNARKGLAIPRDQLHSRSSFSSSESSFIPLRFSVILSTMEKKASASSWVMPLHSWAKNS